MFSIYVHMSLPFLLLLPELHVLLVGLVEGGAGVCRHHERRERHTAPRQIQRLKIIKNSNKQHTVSYIQRLKKKGKENFFQVAFQNF